MNQAGPETTKKDHPIRVMLVDDSAVIRNFISRILNSAPDIEVVCTAANGQIGIQNARVFKPDIVILDIEMPVMDGLTALPLILKERPEARVLMCSTLSERGADISIRAMSLGATDCLLKPSTPDAMAEGSPFQTELLRMVRTLGAIVRGRMERTKPFVPTAPAAPKLYPHDPRLISPPSILAVGSSTGGPNALMALLKPLKGLPVPIVITQHMPQTFTAILAQHIEKSSGIPTVEGAEDMVLEPGHAYVAPGGFHMLFKRTPQGEAAIHIDDGPVENFCRPAVDPMLRSLVSIYGSKILAVILTGMGSDGLKGCQGLIKAGGQTIAQDEASSVVWGMPGAVANAGICSAIAPIPQLAEFVLKAIYKNQPIPIVR